LVDYCEVTDGDISNWWYGHDTQGESGNTAWVIGNTVFLFGHYSDHGRDNSRRGSAGRRGGRANIQGPETRVVFPIMNSRNEIGNEGRPPPIDGIRNPYAEINGSPVPNNSIRRNPTRDQNYVYKGQWVCVKGLSSRDKITFGGEGDLDHKSDAEWNIV
jgi:hypothetical protein